MPVTPFRPDHSHGGRDVCRVCGTELHGTRRDAWYCSDACKMRAYRRRKTARRIEAAERDALREEQRRAHVWRRLFIEQASLSQKQSERVFVLLDSLGRVDGFPFEQLELIDGPAQ